MEQTVGAPCSVWHFRQTPIVVTLVASDIRSISATCPWHIWHFIPASRCLRCVQVTPAELYKRVPTGSAGATLQIPRASGSPVYLWR